MRISVEDRQEITRREITDQGFLKAPAVFARTGIQEYFGSELNMTGADATKIFKLYRPAEEVFKPASIQSFDQKPVTIEHPKGGVNAANWKTHAVGMTNNPQQTGDVMSGELIVNDADAVKTVALGKKWLSNGYSFRLDVTPGKTSTGDSYDAIMRDIVGDHVAIVSNPRGGDVCRIADTKGKTKMENTRIVIVDGIPVEVTDASAAVIDKLQKVVADNAAKLATVVQIGDAKISVSDAVSLQTAVSALVKANDELKAKVTTPEQFAAAVAARVATVADAVKFVPAIVCDGKDDVTIQREVIKEVTAKDEQAKSVVDSILAGKTVEVADAVVVGIAYRAMSAIASKAETKTVADTRIADAFTGKVKVGDAAAPLSGRSLFIAQMQPGYKAAKQ